MKLREAFWICILVTAGIGCEQSADPRAAQKPMPSGHTEPDPVLPQLDLAGLRSLIAASDRQDRVLLLDFWATWCRPCVDLFPRLHRRLKALGNRVRVVTVTLDAPGQGEARAVSMLQRHHATHDAYMLVADSDARLNVVSALGRRWRDLVVPAILVYNIEGRLEVEFLGGEAARIDLIVSEVTRLLDDSSSDAAPSAVTRP